MTTIITEKKDMADKLAVAVGANDLKKGYYEGNGFFVTWAAGHLLEQYVPEAEGEWTIQKLPIIPEQFRLVVRQERQAGKKVTSKNAEQRLFVIKYLLSRSEAVINAGDPGIEGELIQREILEYTDCRLPVWRLWMSSTSTKALQEAMRNLRPSSEFDSLYEAAKSRSEADWLIGINGTIALTCSTESNKTLSLGRVQTPVLAMVCRRYIENEKFVPEPFWKVILTITSENGKPYAVSSERFMNKDEAQKAAQDAMNDTGAYVKEFEQKTVTQRPPLLYDLTELMKAAIKRKGLTAEDVKNAAQSLYMNGFISYPRTPSQFITEHEYKAMPELIDKLRSYEPLSQKAASIDVTNLNTHCVNELRVTDHFGLIITDRIPATLEGNEKIVYELIAERTLEAFSPDCIREQRTATVAAGGNEFKATNSVIIEPGWKAVRGVTQNENEEKTAREEDNKNGELPIEMKLPLLETGERAVPENAVINEGKTTAPPLYTEDTLLDAMKKAGAKPDQEAEKKGLQKGLGTPATRQEIIKTLFTREYISRNGPKKEFIPTMLGMTIYKIVKDKAIADANMTAQWEEALENIIERRIQAKDFNTSIRILTEQLTKELILGDHKKDIMMTATKEIAVCPSCGKKNYMSPKGYFCKYCDFSLYRNIAQKKLTDSQLRNLLEGGETLEIQGFKRKDGTVFSAKLRRDGNKIYFAKK